MKLHIAGLNQNIVWKDKHANFKLITKEFLNVKADLYLLPEMFSTGFCMDAEEIADRENQTLDWMKTFSKEKNAAVAGSVSVFENGKYYNRFYFIEPNGNYHHYDKKHLFSYSGEDKIYAAGEERTIIQYKGISILLQVCYDLRFPVFSRNKNDYDLALYVANWPDTRVDAWLHLLKARAIENQAYIFGLNRIGTDGNKLNYIESSRAYFADGSLISRQQGNIITTEIDLEKLDIFRNKFPFLKDADQFTIKY